MLLQLIKQNIRTEISAIGFQFSIGTILVAIIIFAIIQIGNTLTPFLSSLQNGFTIELVGFGLVALIGMVLLYFLYTDFPRKHVKAEPEVLPDLKTVDMQLIGFRFAEGVLEGFISRREQRRSLPHDVPLLRRVTSKAQ